MPRGPSLSEEEVRASLWFWPAVTAVLASPGDAASAGRPAVAGQPPRRAPHAVAYCADVVVRLQGHHLGPQQHIAGDGRPRVVTPDRDHRYYLDLVCAPVRRSGRGEPQVLTALLRLLRDCAVAARDDRQRVEIARQVDLAVAGM